MSNFFEDSCLKNQCGFRNGYSAEQCLLVMMEKWKRIMVSLVHYDRLTLSL